MMISPKVSPMPTWLTPPSVTLLMMMAPVPAKTRPKVPTNSAASRCTALSFLLRAQRLSSAEIPINHLCGEQDAVLGRGEGFGNDQESIRFGQRTQHARALSAGDTRHVPLRGGLDSHPHVVAAAAPVLDPALQMGDDRRDLERAVAEHFADRRARELLKGDGCRHGIAGEPQHRCSARAAEGQRLAWFDPHFPEVDPALGLKHLLDQIVIADRDP